MELLILILKSAPMGLENNILYIFYFKFAR